MASCRKTDYEFINQHEEAYYQHQSDMSCVTRNSENLLSKVKKQDERKLRKVITHMTKQLGPPWFQELSPNQITAADSIFAAVSDETEDVQYKRCRNVLSAIGLKPLPRKSKTMSAIRFSRNNDLAFLWFIYDSVYSLCEDIASKKSFSLNERLLLSCICHLDMMTTLRELDRILPKPANKETKKAANPIRRPRRSIKYDTLYDEPLSKPKLQPKRFYPAPTRAHPKFELYQRYKDKSFVIENESNRWFAEENLLPTEARKISKGIVCGQINKMFDKNFNRENGLCEQHQLESTRFHHLTKKFLDGLSTDHFDEDCEERIKDCDPFERGVIYGIQMELARCEKESRDAAEGRQKLIAVKTLLRQVVENAADLKFLHLCEKCEKCMQAKQPDTRNEMVAVDDKHETDDDVNRIKFFRRPSSSAPFEFDYEAIFATNFLNDSGIVRNSMNAALELDKHLTENNAITVCLRDMWQSELKQWNEKRRAEMEEKSQRVVADCDKIGHSKQKVYKLLFKGLELMRKNPRFVLASLPDSHRLPILREWALQRFGFRYTDKHNEHRWKMNKFQRDQLEISGLIPRDRIPTLGIFGIKTANVCYDTAVGKVKQRDEWLRNHHKNLASGMIDKSRLYWATMEPHMCDTERMRQIFFANMPSRESEVDRIIMTDIL